MKRNTTVTLGSAENDYLDRISAAMKMAELALNKDGTVKGDQVTGMINMMKTRLKATAENAEKQAAKAILFEELDNGKLIPHTQLSIVDILPEEDIKACQRTDAPRRPRSVRRLPSGWCL